MSACLRIVIIGLSACLIVACSDAAHQNNQQTTEKGAPLTVDSLLVARVHEMADRRLFDKALLMRAVAGGYPEALRLFGHSGDEACLAIRSFLKTGDEKALRFAIEGASRCANVNAFDELHALAVDTSLPVRIRVAALNATGFVAGEQHRAQVATLTSSLLQNLQTPSDVMLAEAATYGLMQNIVYAGLSPDRLPELDLDAVAEAARRNDRLGFEAAYLLMRMQGLRDTLDLADIQAAIAASTLPEKTYALLRVAGGFGNDASALLRQYAVPDTLIEGDLTTDMFNGGETRREAVAAILAMAGLTDEQSLTHLFKLLGHDDIVLKQTALSVMGRRGDADAAVVKRMWDFARSDNEWLAVTAVSGLAGFKDPNALYMAEEWLEGESLYKAYQAINLLAGSEDGRALLESFAERASDPLRVLLATRTLDPGSVQPREERETVPYNDALAATGQILKLTTTRGDIIIEMIEGAPYAAHNFVSLARSGKMDMTIWHRVIPGFVAQAGISSDSTQFNVPTIREEWGAALHEPGTVGVATAGPDTGSSQFFINLSHNRHLDDRYTVFGRVVSGSYGQLQEGDLIISAEVMDKPQTIQ